MKKVIIIVGLLLISLTLKAADYYEQLHYCSWIGTAASAVAKNRDLGIDEYSLIDLYLKQGDSYAEQVIVLSLIDRIYGLQKDEDADMISLNTKTECLGKVLSFKAGEALY